MKDKDPINYLVSFLMTTKSSTTLKFNFCFYIQYYIVNPIHNFRISFPAPLIPIKIGLNLTNYQFT